MKQKLTLIVGWLAACFLLFAALFLIDWELNLWDWDPDWDWRISILGTGVLTSITAIWFLARATRDRLSLIISLILCLALLLYGIGILPPEEVTTVSKSGWDGFFANLLARRSPSPFWFRGGIAVLTELPAVFWLAWTLRHRRNSPPNRRAATNHRPAGSSGGSDGTCWRLLQSVVIAGGGR